MDCDSKKPYGTVTEAMKRLAQLQDPFMHIYVCEHHRALHVGHRRIEKTYKTWHAAFDAVRTMQNQQGVPRRMKIWKSRKNPRWCIGWASTPQRVLTFEQARAKLQLVS